MSTWIPLTIAAYEGHIEICNYLLDQGARVDISQTLTPLMAASIKGRLEIVALFLKLGAKVDVQCIHVNQLLLNMLQHH